MPESALLGTIIVLAGGLSTGCFPLPMKFMRRWSWENVWLVYSVVGLLLLPWAVAFAAMPGLLDIYRAVPAGTLLLTALFGLGWGIGNVLFGEAVAMVGMALTFAVVGGLSAAAGSLIPLIALRPESLGQDSGQVVLLGVAMTVLGVAILGAAGRRRERLLKQASGSNSMALGLGLCIASGLLGSMLNFSFAYGSPIAQEAVRQGAAPGSASHAIWAIAFLGGFAGNGGYAAGKLARNGTWMRFRKSGGAGHWVLGSLMGILFTTGFLLYGQGATLLGPLGPVVGWPAMQATTMIVSTSLGAMSGEWRGADARFVWFTVLGLAVLVSAIVVLSVGNRL